MRKQLILILPATLFMACSAQVKLGGSGADGKIVATGDSGEANGATHSSPPQDAQSQNIKANNAPPPVEDILGQKAAPGKEIAGSFLTDCGFFLKNSSLECSVFEIVDGNRMPVNKSHSLKITVTKGNNKVEFPVIDNPGAGKSSISISEFLESCSDSILGTDLKISGVLEIEKQVVNSEFLLSKTISTKPFSVLFAQNSIQDFSLLNVDMYCIKKFTRVDVSSRNPSTLSSLSITLFGSNGLSFPFTYHLGSPHPTTTSAFNTTNTYSSVLPLPVINAGPFISRISIDGANANQYGSLYFDAVFETKHP